MIYIGSRNPLTIIVLAVLFLTGAMLAKSWMDSQPDIIAEDITSAKILSIHDKEVEYRDKVGNKNAIGFAIAKLELADGKTFNASVLKPYPMPGEKVSVKLVEYSDGTKVASLFR